MFLGTAAHVPVKKNVQHDCFDQLAWKFNAGAAIRSTPVTDDRNIYIATEKGEFFCVEQATGSLSWKFNTSYPIHSSPAIQNGLVFFSDAKQTLYALNTNSGTVAWQTSLGENKPYDWKFDFLWSSPTISGDTIFIGSGDGNLYAIKSLTGEVYWKFAATTHIRCAPAVFYNKVFFGDMNGHFYAIDNKTGKEVWKYETNATRFINDSFGYDRKGIVSSPVVIDRKVIFGARDGFMYNLDTETRKENWVFDYNITWVISSVATDGNAVFSGTSDGRFVNAIDLKTGKELWRTNTNLVWSSPVLINDKLYAGGYDGYLYCLDKKTGAKFNTALYTGGRMQTSPVFSGDRLFTGSDDGYIYALESIGDCRREPSSFTRYVFYDREAPRLYHRNGADILLRANLVNNGFIPVDIKSIDSILKKDIPADSNVVIVFASNYLPASSLQDGKNCTFRKFLNKGGRVVLTGLNPVVYDFDPKTNNLNTDFSKLKSFLDIDFKYNDSRAHGGMVYCSATKQGTDIGLPAWWMAPFPVSADQVDVVLGENVNRDASAYVKKYTQKTNSGLIQIWIDPDFAPADINFVRKVALANF